MSVEALQSQEKCTFSETKTACKQTESGRNNQQLCYVLEKFERTL